MSVKPLNPKNVRKFSDATGIHFNRVVGWGDVNFFEGRTDGDRHFQIDRRTWTATEDPAPVHWSSCRELTEAEKSS